MPSRTADGEPLRRIRCALSKWQITDEVHWNERSATWVRRHLDSTRYTLKEIARLVHVHVEAGGRGAQLYPPGEYDEVCCYSVVLVIEGQKVFVEFVIRPDEAEDPSIVIVSIHEQRR